MASRVARLLSALIAGAAVAAVPSPATADIVRPEGTCTGSGSWQTGAFSELSTDLDRDDVIEVDRADKVQWKGTVVGPASGTARPVAGRIRLLLPPPFGGISVATWSGSATDVERSGTYSYDLPAIVPADVELDLVASHDENGQRHCTGAVGIVIAGSVFDGPLIWIVLAGLLLTGGGLVLLGRRPEDGAGVGRLIAGAVLGLLFGLFGASALVLFGVLPLASVLVTIVIAALLILGAAWARWAPLGKYARVTPEVPPA